MMWWKRYLWSVGPAVLLVLVVGAIFGRAVGYEFSHYDDGLHVLRNPAITSLGFRNLARIFASPSTTNSYYPVRTLTFAVDYAIWGLDPRGYHLGNILFHLANAALVYVLGLRLANGVGAEAPGSGRGRASSFVGALLFGLHPLVVEPVVWVSGREELGMLFFVLLCLLAYVTGVRTQRRGWVALASVLCVCGCMSSALAVVVPLLIAVCDYCLIRRDRAPFFAWLRGVLGRTWPMWVGAVVLVMVKVSGYETLPAYGEFRSLQEMTLTERLIVVPATFWLNVKNAVWPHLLVVAYPSFIARRQAVFGLVCAGAFAWLLWSVRKQKVALFGLAWFLVALVPTAHIIRHHILRADRFLYLALPGLAWALGPGTWSVVRRHARMAALAACCLALGAAVRTSRQIPVWRDGVTLFTHALKADRRSGLVHAQLGRAFRRLGRFEEAVAHFSITTRREPRDADCQFDMAGALCELGRQEEAVTRYSEAIRLRPGVAEIRNDLAVALVSLGRVEEAIEHFTAAAALDPGNAPLRLNTGVMLLRQGRAAEAVPHLSEALRLQPDLRQAREFLAMAVGRL